MSVMSTPRSIRAPRGQRAICTVEGCDRVVVGRGYCGKHYQRVVKHGDPSERLREYWPRVDRERLGELLDIGWSDERIAKDLGRSVSTIRKARLRFGMKPRFRRGHTAREVARIVGVNHMTPQRWIDAGRLPARRNKARYGRHRCLMADHFDLCEFLSNPANWHCYDPAVITDPALRAWLTRLRGNVRFITLKNAAFQLGCQYMKLWHMVKREELDAARDSNLIWVRQSDIDVLKARWAS